MERELFSPPIVGLQRGGGISEGGGLNFTNFLQTVLVLATGAGLSTGLEVLGLGILLAGFTRSGVGVLRSSEDSDPPTSDSCGDTNFGVGILVISNLNVADFSGTGLDIFVPRLPATVAVGFIILVTAVETDRFSPDICVGTGDSVGILDLGILLTDLGGGGVLESSFELNTTL